MNKDCQRAQSVPTVRQMSLEHCQNSSFRFETLVQVPLLIEGLDDAFVRESLAPLTHRGVNPIKEA